MESLKQQVVTATKWSALTEIVIRLVSPIAGMILARLLTPEAYGAVATTSIVITFAELFTDAGFQRYIIQHDFVDDDDLNKSANVAFWSNLVMSLIIWGIIIAFRHPIARLVGSPELGTAISVACAAIPLASFSSFHKAIFKRNLNFRIPFIGKVFGMCVTFVVTIPLAIATHSYWALIISNLINYIFAAVFYRIHSYWRPEFYFSFKRLRKMFAFCNWIIINSILSWITNYADIFIVGTHFNQHALGIYKTSISRSNNALRIISSSVIPVLLPTYSKLQNNIPQLRITILKIQKYLGVLLMPFGLTMFLYSDVIVRIYLGNQWFEAAQLIGTWTLVHTFSLLINRFCSNAYVAIGKPHISLILSVLYAAMLIPTVLLTVDYGLQTLFVVRTLTKLVLLLLHLITIYLVIRLSPLKIIGNIAPQLLGCAAMVGTSFALNFVSNHIIWKLASMLICLTVYFGILLLIKQERVILLRIWQYAIEKMPISRQSAASTINPA